MTATSIPPGFADPDAVAGPVSIRQSVAWGELDAMRHVNHTVFLRWLENVRLRWFDRVGVGATLREPERSGGLNPNRPEGARGAGQTRSGWIRIDPANNVGPILARIECDYRAPVEFPDVIWASARCVELGRSSLTLQSHVWSERRAAIVAEGRVVMVMIDYVTQRSVAIPEPVRAAIVALDQPRERGGQP